MKRFATAVAAGVFMLAACTSPGTTSGQHRTDSPGRPSSSGTVVPPLPGHIVFSDDLSLDSVSFRIYSITSDGSGRAELTTPPGTAEDHHPRYSPDGTQIAFDREDRVAGDRIEVVNADGTGLHV